MCKSQVFLIFANNSRSKQIKKNQDRDFVDIGQYETRAKFQKKNSTLW